jgi:hypothetical protein
MDRDIIRRIVWVGTLLAVLIGMMVLLLRHGAEWGPGAAP